MPVNPLPSPHPRRLRRPALVLLAFSIALAGCSHSHSADIVARVNGKPVYTKDVEALYQNSIDGAKQTPSLEQADIVRLSIVRELIDEEILAQRAAKLNLTATDEEVDSQLNEMKAPFTKEEFARKLDQRHLTMADLRRDIRRKQTSQKLFNKEINSKVNITDEDISSYFNAHKSDYDLPEPQYHIAEIVVTSQPLSRGQANSAGNLQNSKAGNEAEAKKKIQMIRTQLENGQDFATLAANFSERPDNASSGGDMGFFPESQLKGDMAVFNAIDDLKPGQITPVLPLTDPNTHKQVGYAIYRLIDKEAAGQLDLNDPRVQQSIRQQLRETRGQLLKNAYIEVLRDHARVENYFAESIFQHGVQ